MKRIILILLLGVCSASAGTQAQSGRTKPGPDIAINDQAAAALKNMAAFLRGLKTFRIVSESSRDEIVDKDMKVQKIATNTITVQMPDHFHALVQGDYHDLQFIYDGETMTLFSPKQNFYASAPAPPTVSKTLDAIRARYGIAFPMADFIQMAAGDDLMQEITGAGYIGTSQIDGVECDHIAIRQPEVDWQVWIERGDRPLPRKIVITTKKQPSQPQYTAMLTWDLTPNVDPALFTFTPPPDATRIKFARKPDTGSQQ